MRLLVIGGTRFAGRSLSEQALAAGHDLTLFHRGTTGAELFPEVEHVLGDRKTADIDRLAGRRFDAVVDFCGFFPRSVGASARLLASSGWYGFVSSISAHADTPPPGANEDTPLWQPPFPETEEITGESYGPLKVACEQQVAAVFGPRAAVVRPGFIVGPHDPTDRFTSLVRRAADGGEMLVPGPSDAPLQYVDARDLAAFLLHLAEGATGGTWDVVHPARTATIADVVEAARRAAGADTTFTWADPVALKEALGDDADEAFPLWAPDEPGFHLFDSARAVAAGLRSRPVADTVRDTLLWDRTLDRAVAKTLGLAPERERELLAALR